MKRIYIFSLLLTLSTLFCQAQQSFFDKYAEMDGVTSVYITKSMLKMFPSMSGTINGVDVGNLASKLENIQILSADDSSIIEQLRKDTKHINSKNGYEELIRVRDDGDKTTIYFKEQKKNSEFILITDSGNEFTIISIVGNDISLKDIQDMTNRTVEDL